ncbi:MAG: methyltransferase domain-containing protein [Gemmatimonadota bacterium]|nr:methyltransferase domain-containing protein [Gemmatimonadota bacterium]
MPSLAHLLVPRRRRGVEFLDEPGVDPEIVKRSLADVARANALFGGGRAAVAELRRTMRAGARITILDIGTGSGDIPRMVREVAGRDGLDVRTLAVESSAALATTANSAELPVIIGDALALPLRDASVDIAMCSQVLHHFEHDRAVRLLREMDRVARHRAVVSDLRRSWIAAAGIWLASFPLGFHPVSRHDGVVSVMRGFRKHELVALVREATGTAAEAHDRLGFRVTVSWNPTGRAAAYSEHEPAMTEIA